MGIFRKRKSPALGRGRGIVAERIAVWILSSQRRIADQINSHLASIPRKKLFAYLALCAVCMAFYCCWLLVQAFY
jgi:hypothetical protein